MDGITGLCERMERVRALLRAKHGARGATLARQVQRAGRLLPRHVKAQVRRLAEAEAVMDNPRLRPMLDAESLARAADEVIAHLDAIDLDDRRKGWILGVLGGLSVNLILAAVALVAFLVWRGIL